MFLIRKINSNDLRDFTLPEDKNKIILSITEKYEMFINNKDGKQIQIRQIIPIESEDELQIIAPVDNKFYFIKDPIDLRFYADGQFISFKEELLKEINDSIQSVHENNEKIKELEEKFNQLSEDTDTKIENSSKELIDSIAEVRSKVDECEQSVEANSNIINAINKSLKVLGSGLEKAEETIGLHQQYIEEINSNIEVINKNIAEIEYDVTDLTNTINELKSKFTKFESDATEKYAQIDKNSADIVTLQETMADFYKFRAVYDISNPKSNKLVEPVFVPEVYLLGGYSLKVNNATIISLSIESPVTLEVEVYDHYLDDAPSLVKEIRVSPDVLKSVCNLNDIEMKTGYIQFKIKEGSGSNHIVAYIEATKFKIPTEETDPDTSTD